MIDENSKSEVIKLLKWVFETNNNYVLDKLTEGAVEYKIPIAKVGLAWRGATPLEQFSEEELCIIYRLVRPYYTDELPETERFFTCAEIKNTEKEEQLERVFEENKKEFIEELPTDELKNIYASLFARARKFEKIVKKDILDFNLEECRGLIFNLNPKSIIHIDVFKSQLGKYADWGIKKHKIATSHWSLVHNDKEYVKFAFSKRYVKDDNELKQVVDSTLIRAFDKCMVYLLYCGIMGEACVELRCILKDDAEANNRTITIGKRNGYTVPMIEPLAEIIKREEYEGDPEMKKRDWNSPYLIKPFNTKKLSGEPIGKTNINAAFIRMNNAYCEINKSESGFTPLTIWKSGLFYTLYEIEREKGELTNSDYKDVCERFGKKPELSNSFAQLRNDYKVYKEVFWD